MTTATFTAAPATADDRLEGEPIRVPLGDDHWAVAIDCEAACDAIADDWEDLASGAACRNVFYEPWNLRPAWRTFGGLDRLIAIYRRGRTKQHQPTLIGLFPTMVRSRPSSWLGKRAELWSHPFGFLRTPLCRRGFVLEAIDGWSRAVAAIWPAIQLAVWERIYAEGAVAHALTDWWRRSSRERVIAKSFNRAICRPASKIDAEQYIETAVSKKQRRELIRLRKRLGDIGSITTTRPRTDDEVEAFAEAFLRLEAAGWKGENETAIAADPGHAAYFRTIIADAARRGQLNASELRLDDRVIASKLSFISAGEGKRRVGFATKIAYDETLAKFSPGVLLELETIRWMHGDDSPAWIDSCALPDHPMIDRLWSERVAIQHVAFELPSAGRLTALRLTALACRTAQLRRKGESRRTDFAANY